MTLVDVWMADQVTIAAQLAREIGCTATEAFTLLFQPQFRAALEFTVPRWSGVSVPRPQTEDEWEQTIVWRDGSCERVASESRGSDTGENPF